MQYLKKISLGFYLLLSYFHSFSQEKFIRKNDIEVLNQGKLLDFPWTGGANFCQFSSIDLNNDGLKDLFVFDRSGNRVLTFLNSFDGSSFKYVFSPLYATKFPALNNWVLLADYNCDGKEDIFTSVPGGISIYKNTSDSSGLKFESSTNLLLSNYKPLLINLYVSGSDIPSVVDIDNDGDLDILSFGVQGNHVEYHKNLSMELYGHCDSLSYLLETTCWGNFSEDNQDNQVSLNVPCGSRSFENNGSRHSGSTLLAFDKDNDQDKDLLIGDVSATRLLFLTNGGNPQEANMVAQDLNFPSNTLAANLFTFPAAFYVDVDHDNKRDLIVCPNAPNVSENFESIYLYKNTGTDLAPEFEFIKNNFLQDQMIDVGEGAYPILFDIDKDGKTDLFVGNFGYFNNSSGIPNSQIAYFKNIGTSSIPKFELITRDFANLSSTGFLNIFPTFGDIDNDGDFDMIIGEQDGAIHLYENTGQNGNSFNYTLTGPNYLGIDVGQTSCPQLFDVNEDGKLDLIIGERNGTLNYLENSGTLQIPAFNLLVESWGGVDVKAQGSTTGYSIPQILKDNGNLILLVGAENGNLYQYSKIRNNLNGNFLLISSNVQPLYQGIRISPSAADLNNDGFKDLVIGNYAGGLALFYGNSFISSIDVQEKNMELKIHPNPFNKQLKIDISDGQFPQPKTLQIMNLLGKIVHQQQLTENNFMLDTEDWPSGIFFARVFDSSISYTQKIIKAP